MQRYLKKWIQYSVLILFVAQFILSSFFSVNAQSTPPTTDPQTNQQIQMPACQLGACPTDLLPVYGRRNESCAASYESFRTAPTSSHYWIEDPNITDQGKSNERARQFIYWVFNTRSIDDSPILKGAWTVTSNITFFLVVFVVGLLGIGYVVNQRMQYRTRLDIWPILTKIAGVLLYVTFSATLIIFFIQVSEILIRFFFETLGGKDFFNIYFSPTNTIGGAGGITSESNYLNFIGCRDLNMRVQEGVNSQLFLFKATNITYYVLGGMILLRKIVLWFMLFVAPFAAILIPFVFVRNVAWVWLGVFLQWLFYGPLLTLFLGMTALIWKQGIPFIFDFSRVDKINGYIYPTAINITYGGPAQKLGALNNGNYVDTFAEYIISLIMLWAAIVLPWWLLRIFRDYCCEYLMSMKNILLSMYDTMRSGNTPPLTPTRPAQQLTTTKIKQEEKITEVKQLNSIEEIKKATTSDIMKSVNISATSLTDVARLETVKTTQEEVKQHIDNLRNPMKAESPTQRQRYMNIRTELFNRALKEDQAAKRLLTTISTSPVEQRESALRFAKELATVSKPTQAVVLKSNAADVFMQTILSSDIVKDSSISTQLPQEMVKQIVTGWYQHVDEKPQTIVENLYKNENISKTILQTTISNPETVPTIHNDTGLPIEVVQKVLGTAQTLLTDIQLSTLEDQVAAKTQVPVEEVHKVFTSLKKQETNAVKKVIGEVHSRLFKRKDLVTELSKKTNITEERTQTFLQSQINAAVEESKEVEKTIEIPQTVSIEDYEAVKSMWKKQYETGDVPVTENIVSRYDWIEKDIVFITNTLNKLTSSDELVRQQGVEDIGYILPIFMVNNFTGPELLVYLKAKLEAAKIVQESLEKEQSIKDKLEAKATEQFVDVANTKKEEQAKTMQSELELTLPTDNAAPAEKKNEG